MQPKGEVADIFRRHGDSFRAAQGHRLSLDQRKVMAAIEGCRTSALGGHVERCEDCGETRIAYNSCLMGKICNGESVIDDIGFATVSGPSTPHYDLSLSKAISLSGGRKEPFLTCGGTMASHWDDVACAEVPRAPQNMPPTSFPPVIGP